MMQAREQDNNVEFPVTETVLFADKYQTLQLMRSPRRSGWRAQPDNVDIRGWNSSRSSSPDRRRRGN